jgi:hypothetical protein
MFEPSNPVVTLVTAPSPRLIQNGFVREASHELQH